MPKDYTRPRLGPQPVLSPSLGAPPPAPAGAADSPLTGPKSKPAERFPSRRPGYVNQSLTRHPHGGCRGMRLCLNLPWPAPRARRKCPLAGSCGGLLETLGRGRADCTADLTDLADGSDRRLDAQSRRLAARPWPRVSNAPRLRWPAGLDLRRILGRRRPGRSEPAPCRCAPRRKKRAHGRPRDPPRPPGRIRVTLDVDAFGARPCRWPATTAIGDVPSTGASRSGWIRRPFAAAMPSGAGAVFARCLRRPGLGRLGVRLHGEPGEYGVSGAYHTSHKYPSLRNSSLTAPFPR